MTEQFNNKDYGDYFSALEKQLERDAKKQTASQSELQKPKTQVTKGKKRIFGGVWRIRPIVPISLFAVLCIVLTAILIPKNKGEAPADISKSDNASVQSTVSDEPKKENLFAEFTDNTADIPSNIESKNVIVVNCDTNKVVASRGAAARCYPASTTKIMTILTAVDYITDYDKTFTFSYEVTDPFYIAEATMAGFAANEAVNMTDLLYGTILPSGADGCAGLAITIAGSEAEFAKLMNKKAKELGLKNTNFTNASGLFDKNHYTTPEDMAVIVRAAMKNELCRKILSTYKYTTAATEQHPEGIELTSTLFSHIYGTEPEGADIIGGKTGFVNESGYCIASFGKSDGGTEYVCVTLGGNGLWPTVYDQFALYTDYAK